MSNKREALGLLIAMAIWPFVRIAWALVHLPRPAKRGKADDIDA